MLVVFGGGWLSKASAIAWKARRHDEGGLIGRPARTTPDVRTRGKRQKDSSASVDVGDNDAVRDSGRAFLAWDLELGRVNRGDAVACRREHPSLRLICASLPDVSRQIAADEGQVTTGGGRCIERQCLLCQAQSVMRMCSRSGAHWKLSNRAEQSSRSRSEERSLPGGWIHGDHIEWRQRAA